MNNSSGVYVIERRFDGIPISTSGASIVKSSLPIQFTQDIDSEDQVLVRDVGSTVNVYDKSWSKCPVNVHNESEVLVEPYYADVVTSASASLFLPTKTESLNISTSHSSDHRSVTDLTLQSTDRSDKITHMVFECQVGMYFEVYIDALSSAIATYSLPSGMRASSTKIYGAPHNFGLFKSYVAMPGDYVIEVEFKIGELVRIL